MWMLCVQLAPQVTKPTMSCEKTFKSNQHETAARRGASGPDSCDGGPWRSGFPGHPEPPKRVLPRVMCAVSQKPGRSAISFRSLTATLWRRNRILRHSGQTGTMERPLRWCSPGQMVFLFLWSRISELDVYRGCSQWNFVCVRVGVGLLRRGACDCVWFTFPCAHLKGLERRPFWIRCQSGQEKVASRLVGKNVFPPAARCCFTTCDPFSRGNVCSESPPCTAGSHRRPQGANNRASVQGGHSCSLLHRFAFAFELM